MAQHFETTINERPVFGKISVSMRNCSADSSLTIYILNLCLIVKGKNCL